MSDQDICKGSAFYWQLVDFLKVAGANDPEHAAWWIVEEFQLSKLTDEELDMAVMEGEIMVNK